MTKTDSYQISLFEFGFLLKRWRTLNRWTLIDVSHHLLEGLRDNDYHERNDEIRKKFGVAPYAALRELEQTLVRTATIELSWEAIELLAQSYQIPPVMLLPYCSTADAEHVRQIFEEDFFGPGIKGRNYRFPKRRLKDCDAVVVHLVLPKGGEAETHHHQGDELIVVLKGRVQPVFANSSTEVTPLEQGEWIHFYSEATHSLKNLAKGDSELFIIRFNQLHGGFRQLVMDDVEQLDTAFRERASVEKIETIFHQSLAVWMNGWSEQMKTGDTGSTDVVRNAAGIAILLKVLGRPPAPIPRKLAKLYASLCLGKPEKRPNLLEDLQELATVFNVPDFLFFTYIYPRVSSCVTIREADLRPLPSISRYSNIPGLEYQIPSRALGGSDVCISRLTLQPGYKTSPHHHPGFEWVLPISGRIRVGFGAQEALAEGLRSYIVLSSQRDHFIECMGDTPATLLVIRFHGFQPSLAPLVRTERKRGRPRKKV